jgi:DNA polymerase-1
VLVAVAAGEGGGGWLQTLADDGAPSAAAEHHGDLASAIARREKADSPRWVWACTAAIYPRLLRAGVRVARCHDLELTEALLLGHDGRWGEPRSLAALWARRNHLPVPPDVDGVPESIHSGQEALFEDLPAPAVLSHAGEPIDAVVTGFVDQRERVERTGDPRRFRLLVAVESAGALAAAEMGHDGLPWRADVHDALLVELLGDPPVAGAMPPRLVELKQRIAEAFGGGPVHPESPADLLRAFTRAGIALPSTRSFVLKGVDHPAVAPLLEFKELYRVWTAHGWAWRSQWVHKGRFHPEYVPGGVVSGRWATRGGGALQIPKVVRRAVMADDGWKLVVADAGQLEPRVLAAMAGDQRFTEAGRAGDLYQALAAEAFGGDRARAKVAMLGAMYGQTGGSAVPALAALQARYPVAWEFVERAARTGEGGGLVRSWLGRTCPPARGRMSGEQARARGRFTRNFVVQATAAEWALALLATVRSRLPEPARLVFFQHDEIVVHTPAHLAPEVVEHVHASGEIARRLLFGDSVVRFPLDVSIVDCYADAKG